MYKTPMLCLWTKQICVYIWINSTKQEFFSQLEEWFHYLSRFDKWGSQQQRHCIWQTYIFEQKALLATLATKQTSQHLSLFNYCYLTATALALKFPNLHLWVGSVASHFTTIKASLVGAKARHLVGGKVRLVVVWNAFLHVIKKDYFLWLTW